VVDDHEAVLKLIKDLLAAEFDVVGTAIDGQAMISAAETLAPDVIVADIDMPGMNGIEATESVLKSRPAQRVVFLTMHRDASLVRRAFEIGARGYVNKQRAAEDLVPAIHCILEGGTFVSPR
jgi:DNA-binding NarL/FixJ family response regulator